MLYLWDVTLSSVSFSGLVMSIGLSIDYNVHVAHAFLHGKGKTVELRTRYAYDMIGFTVLKGGLTTLAGTIVLSMASSTVFRIFFKICFGTVVSGILHGLILMPCLLGWYVTIDTKVLEHEEEED
jgi:Niemann-Pick C1 protein